MTSIVFVALFAILSVLDCFLGEDGWYLVDLKQSQDAKHYFGERLSLLEKYNYQSEMKNHKSHYISDKLRTASPVHNIHIECFHTETKSAINTFKGNILTIGTGIGLMLFWDLRASKFLESTMNSNR